MVIQATIALLNLIEVMNSVEAPGLSSCVRLGSVACAAAHGPAAADGRSGQLE